MFKSFIAKIIFSFFSVNVWFENIIFGLSSYHSSKTINGTFLRRCNGVDCYLVSLIRYFKRDNNRSGHYKVGYISVWIRKGALKHLHLDVAFESYTNYCTQMTNPILDKTFNLIPRLIVECKECHLLVQCKYNMENLTRC